MNEAVGVDLHVERLRRGLQPDAHAVGVGKSAIGLDRLLHQGARRATLNVEFRLPGFELLDVQNIVDQADQPPAIGMGDFDETRRGFRQAAGRAADQKAERTGNRGHRRAQLVAHRGDEFVMQALDPLAFADIDDGAEHHDIAVNRQRIEADFDRELAAVLAPPEKLAPGSEMAGVGAQHESAALARMFVAQFIGQQNFDRPAKQFLAPVAEQAFDFSVDHHDGAVAADEHHAARGSLDREPENFRRRHAAVSSRVNGHFNRSRRSKDSDARFEAFPV